MTIPKSGGVYDLLDLLDAQPRPGEMWSILVDQNGQMIYCSETKDEFLTSQEFSDQTPDHFENEIGEEMFIFEHGTIATIFNVEFYNDRKYVVDSDLAYYSYDGFCRLFLVNQNPAVSAQSSIS